jgi:undecaprenyl diphosphate synthase
MVPRPRALTAGNTRITLTVAVNYGGRWDVVQACRRCHGARAQPAQDRTEAVLSRAHCAGLRARPRPLHPHRRRDAHQQLPALAGGLQRTLLHRLPVARLRAAEVDAALAAYAGRDRRFGGVTRLEGSARGRTDAAALGQRILTAVVLLAVLLPAMIASRSEPFVLAASLDRRRRP